MLKRIALLWALVLVTSASPAFSQADAWQRKWYWGVHAGAFTFETPTSTGQEYAIGGGIHWLITGKRSALYLGLEQFYFPDSATSAIPDASVTNGIRMVDFSMGRRIQALLFAVPTDGPIQVMLGGGFSINQVTNGTPQGPFANLSEVVNAGDLVAERDTRAFWTLAGGAQYRVGRLAVFGNYQFHPSASNYLISSNSHALVAGIRYALTGSHEEVTTQ